MRRRFYILKELKSFVAKKINIENKAESVSECDEHGLHFRAFIQIGFARLTTREICFREKNGYVALSCFLKIIEENLFFKRSQHLWFLFS